MDWLLAALAIFNLISMLTVFSPRSVPRRSVPWALFFTALIATELAWIWLPTQLMLSWLLVSAGALARGLGAVAMLILFCTWPGLIWSIHMSAKAEAAMDRALRSGLGENYRNQIPPGASHLLRSKVSFRDWWLPFGMKRPGVERIPQIP